MDILLVYLPFCTPASPPYSLTALHSFLMDNCTAEIDVLDLNLEFHKLKYPEYQKYCQAGDFADYESVTKKHNQEYKLSISANNKKILRGETPEFYDELLSKIKQKKPDIVAFSVVYSSQAFFAYSLVKELDCVTVVGGPSVNRRLSEVADHHFANEVEFLSFIKEGDVDHHKLNLKGVPDFSIYDLDSYFVPSPVVPLKTSTTCFYKQCTFCSHYAKVPYMEYGLDIIEKTVVRSEQKYFFLIDDMIPKGRILKLAEMFERHGVKWACQLKPSRDWDLETMKTLYASGLLMVIWGVESGCQRILDLMKKGTTVEVVESTLLNSHLAGIKNVTYVMFGFPTETGQEFIETIEFLKKNIGNIDLISESVFGLQEGTPTYNDPAAFGIINVNNEKRKMLDDKISYEVISGMNQEAAKYLKRRYKRSIENINKYPKTMNFFRGHMLCFIDKNK